MISSTSQEAYAKIQAKLGDKQLIVYEAIKELGIATNEMIADHLNWPLNRVTGRCTELNRYGVIQVEGLGRNKSGFSAKQWSICDLNDRKLMDISNDCGD